MLFARSATAGGQQFPVHWGGDCESTFASRWPRRCAAGCRSRLPGSGSGATTSAGSRARRIRAVFKRWIAFGLLSSHSRLHGSESYRVPWAFDEEAVDVTREFTALKIRLMPYLVRAAPSRRTSRGMPVHAADAAGVPRRPGVPPPRPPVHARRRTCSSPRCSTTDGDVEFYVPAGRWMGLLDGQVVDGPRWVRQRHDFHSLPLLVRPGSVIAVGSRADRPDYDDAVAPTFEVFDLADGGSTVTHLYDELGRERVSLRVARDGSRVVAEVVAGVEQLTRGLASDLGHRTVRRTDRTDRRGGVRAGDPRSRPRAVAAGIRDRMTVRNFHMLFTATYTRLRDQCGPRGDASLGRRHDQSCDSGGPRSQVPPRGTLRPEQLKRNNMGRLLTRVHLMGPTSRATLTRDLGLNRSTIGDLTSSLVDLGLVTEAGTVSTHGNGRPSYVVQPRDDVTVIGVNLGVDRNTVASVGLGGEVLSRRERPHHRGEHDMLSVVESLGQMIEDACGRIGTDAAWVSASPCRAQSGCATASSRFAPNLGWVNAPFTAALSSRLGMTVVCDNDAHLGARAEHLRGVAVGRDNIAYLAGSVGVGGGFIVGGQPLTGASGYAGEIGHLSLDPDGPACRCGNSGCFETKISENRLLTLAGRLPGGGPEAVQEVIGAACAGEERASEALDDIAGWLALGLRAVINIFNPEMVVLGDSLALVWQARASEIRARLGELPLISPIEPPRDRRLRVRARRTPRGRGRTGVHRAPGRPRGCRAPDHAARPTRRRRDERMRFGLVGTGPWAELAHGPGLGAAEGVELVGVWGRTPSRAEPLAQTLGVTAYDDYAALLADVEAVAFAVPPAVQAELALEAAAAGRHLLLDKPVATDLGAARTLLAAATEAGVSSVVFFTDRFVDATRTWIDHVRGTEGWHGAWVRWFSALQEPGNPFGASPWRHEAGGLWDTGPHALSTLTATLGPISSLTAVGRPG